MLLSVIAIAAGRSRSAGFRSASLSPPPDARTTWSFGELPRLGRVTTARAGRGCCLVTFTVDHLSFFTKEEDASLIGTC